jgi:TolB-like protein
MRTARPLLALLVALAAATPSHSFAAEPAPKPADMAPPGPIAPETTVLVLPFTATDGEAQDAWIGRAISQSLTADLSIDRTMQVSSDKTADADTTAEAAAAGAKADAKQVIFGSFQHVGQDVRITGHIVDVASGKVTAGLKATGPLQELFTLQDSLAHQVRVRIGQAELPPPPFARAPVAPAPAFEDDGVLGVEMPRGPRPIAWLDDADRNDQFTDTVRDARNRRQNDFPAPIYNGYYFYGGWYGYYLPISYGYGYGQGYGCRPYYPTVQISATYSSGDGWNGRIQTQGYGMVGGAARATQTFQPYQASHVPFYQTNVGQVYQPYQASHLPPSQRNVGATFQPYQQNRSAQSSDQLIQQTQRQTEARTLPVGSPSRR